MESSPELGGTGWCSCVLGSCPPSRWGTPLGPLRPWTALGLGAGFVWGPSFPHHDSVTACAGPACPGAPSSLESNVSRCHVPDLKSDSKCVCICHCLTGATQLTILILSRVDFPHNCCSNGYLISVVNGFQHRVPPAGAEGSGGCQGRGSGPEVGGLNLATTVRAKLDESFGLERHSSHR